MADPSNRSPDAAPNGHPEEPKSKKPSAVESPSKTPSDDPSPNHMDIKEFLLTMPDDGYDDIWLELERQRREDKHRPIDF